MVVSPQKRIALAFLAGAVIVAGAFIVSRQSSTAHSQGEIGVTTIEHKNIKITDSNEDGVPDWQDALQKTEPLTLPQASSTYEAPTTVTGKFAVNFFEDYVRSKTYGDFGDTKEELIAKSTQALAAQAQDEFFTEKDISIFNSSDEETLHAYGNHVASIILAHPNSGDSEAIILQDVIRYDTPERLAELEPIALAYTIMIKELLQAPVPENHVKKHLDLVNALNAVKEDTRAMQKMNEDPMYTLLRLKRYEDDVLGMSNALSNLFSTLYLEDNVRWSEGEPVLKLITFTQ